MEEVEDESGETVEKQQPPEGEVANEKQLPT